MRDSHIWVIAPASSKLRALMGNDMNPYKSCTNVLSVVAKRTLPDLSKRILISNATGLEGVGGVGELVEARAVSTDSVLSASRREKD